MGSARAVKGAGKGWRSGYERGHLLASQLGGPGTNRGQRNFVPLTPSVNSAMRHGVEKEVADRMHRKGRIFHAVVPEYFNNRNHIPKKTDVWIKMRQTLMESKCTIFAMRGLVWWMTSTLRIGAVKIEGSLYRKYWSRSSSGVH
ncbi:DNA/RNA non-specific endonuclease [Actinomadura viridis]|uniref:DNA/RNA non-specific endonuclease n=1 Tax=Actinomadura viridis TaxID=58110 RepID=UPI0036B8AA1C